MTAAALREPLAGIRVLDLSRFIAGPFCAMLLGDLGADVVKVESVSGEQGRRTGPTHDGESLYTSWFNRNKRAITLDMRSAEGFAVLTDLIRSADVLVENFRPGTLDKMGLSADVLDELNATLVVVSISGFGQTGPYRERVAFDAIAQAMSGLMWATGTDADGPRMVGTFVADHVTGLYAAIGALAALHARRDNGVGQSVDVSLLDATFSLLGVGIPNYVASGEAMTRTGNRDQMVAPSGLFECADGHVYISAGNNEMFGRLIEVLDVEELRRPEYADLDDRLARVGELEEIVGAWARTRTVEEIAAALDPAGIPVGRVSSLAQAVEDEQIVHRQMVRRVGGGDEPEYIVPGFVINLSKTPSEIRLPPPVLGQDTAAVVAEWCDVDTDEISRLRAAGAFDSIRERRTEEQ
jgi:crotonobetainyl-CoA:carnitine CoA-transferase CaiB-like acyl-CoA transferase